MIFLDTTGKDLEIVLAGAPGTQLPWTVGYSEQASDNSTSAGKSADGVTNSTTAVVMVAAPGGSLVRIPLRFSVWNADNAAATVTIQLNDSSTLRVVMKVTLQPGDNLLWSAGSEPTVLDSSGNVKGRYFASPLTPPDGGTGLVSPIAHTFLVAQGASAMTAMAVGTKYQVVVGVTSGDPVWSSALPLIDQADPSQPSSGYGLLYGYTQVGFSMPRYYAGADAVPFSLQPWLAGRANARLVSSGGAGNSGAGIANVSLSGTLAALAPTFGTYKGQWQRNKLPGTGSGTGVGPCTMTAVASSSKGMCWRGNGAGLGGFVYVQEFCLGTNTNGAMGFFGLRQSTTAIGNADPSSQTNIIGLGFDAADSSSGNWILMYNDGTGTATRTDLGSSFPRNTTDPIRLKIGCSPNGSTMTVEVTNRATGAVYAPAALSSDLPVNTDGFCGFAELNNRATSGTTQEIHYGTNEFSVETDY